MREECEHKRFHKGGCKGCGASSGAIIDSMQSTIATQREVLEELAKEAREMLNAGIMKLPGGYHRVNVPYSQVHLFLEKIAKHTAPEGEGNELQA